MKISLLLGLTMTVTASVSAQQSVQSRVDSIFRRYDNPQSPGCAVGVMQNDRLIYTRGYGMANLEHAIPITPTSIFHVASISKQFTAASILLLAQQGKLTVDDDIRKHIPELPDFGIASRSGISASHQWLARPMVAAEPGRLAPGRSKDRSRHYGADLASA